MEINKRIFNNHGRIKNAICSFFILFYLFYIFFSSSPIPWRRVSVPNLYWRPLLGQISVFPWGGAWQMFDRPESRLYRNLRAEGIDVEGNARKIVLEDLFPYMSPAGIEGGTRNIVHREIRGLIVSNPAAAQKFCRWIAMRHNELFPGAELSRLSIFVDVWSIPPDFFKPPYGAYEIVRCTL